MTSLYNAPVNAIRGALAPYGLMDSYLSRFAVFSLGTAGILWLTKPKRFFDTEGRPYPSSLMTTPGEGFSTDIDWITASALVGLFGITAI